MAVDTFVPYIAPQLLNLIQTNSLSRMVRESLGLSAAYRVDATPEEMPQGIGTTLTMARVGRMDADLRPVNAIGATPRGEYGTETFTARPRPYAQSVEVDGPTAFVQTAGNMLAQKISRLSDWAARTSSRIARSRLFTYCAGQSIIRRAQTTGDAVLLVNSLAGFRFLYVNGVPVAVSATTPLPITIVAGTTFTALVTGVTPLDADFPDGPGQLTLSTTLSAIVAVQSYVYVTDSRPKIVRPNNRASTEALVAGDIPTLKDILIMKARLVDRGVPVHASSGTYHLHVDAWFFVLVTSDTAWRQAFQTVGLSPIFGANAVWSKALGITIIENNDSPAMGKGRVVQVGAAGFTIGAMGTPALSQSMADNGIDVVNSTGVSIRRAIMTGDDVMTEAYVDESKYIELVGGKVIHQISNDFNVIALGSTNYVAGSIDRWRLLVRPPLDERALVTTITMSATFDYVLGTDREAISDTTDKSPLKRAIILEHGSDTYLP